MITDDRSLLFTHSIAKDRGRSEKKCDLFYPRASPFLFSKNMYNKHSSQLSIINSLDL